MSKLFLFVLVLAVIYYLRRALRGEGGTDKAKAVPQTQNKVEMMSECAHCGLLVPQSEGIELGGAFYCGTEHARLGPRNVK